MNLNDIITIAIAFGGIETIKYIIESIRNRRTNKRKEAAGATGMELENRSKEAEIYQQHIRFLEQQLQERNLKFDALYKDRERLAEQNTQLIIENSELKVANKELELWRCDLGECSDRRPPRRLLFNRKNRKKENESNDTTN